MHQDLCQTLLFTIYFGALGLLYAPKCKCVSVKEKWKEETKNNILRHIKELPMSKTKKVPRSRGMMYTQQVQHSPYKIIDDLKIAIETKVKPKRYAIIKHDKDIDDKGNPESDHWQVMLEFDNPRYVTSIAKLLGDKPQSVHVWNNKISNGFAYLVHRTQNASSKYQYEPSEVVANFDYIEELAKITRQVKKSSTNVKDLLDDLYDGRIKKDDLENALTGSQYGKCCKQIEDVNAKRLQKEAETFRQKLIESGTPVRVIWIYGKPGTGKTTIAKIIAKRENRPYFISGSSRDIFQDYKGEHTVILDELRPKVIEYADLLRITDPYSPGAMAPSRYHDKYLACDLIIITSPYSPISFYDETFGITRQNLIRFLSTCIDTFEQLERRIMLTIHVEDTQFYMTEYDGINREYIPKVNTYKNNPYSATSRQINQMANGEELFEKLFS